MDFDDSLFEDFSNNKKEKKKQSPYSVRLQDFRWFLLDNSSADNTRVTEQLKYKADYLFAQRKYTEALKYYEELSAIIPASNSVLTQEVSESRILCLTSQGETDKAEKSLEEMIKENQMNTSLWHAMFLLKKGKNNFEEAMFAIQHCLKDNEDVALYWIDLAETYALQSKCLACLNELNTGTCRYQKKNKDQENLANVDVEQKPEEKELLWNTYTETPANEEVLKTRMSNCTIEECNAAVVEESLSAKYNKLQSYAEKHHYCYCSLCSFIISRFLLYKYSNHSQFTNHLEENENIRKVDLCIENITCVTNEILDETRKLLRVKFAHRIKSSELSLNQSQVKTSQEFNNRWFPFK